MIEVRRARAEDAGELCRLRQVMWTTLDARKPEPGPWQENALTTLRNRLGEPDPTVAGFVVARPDGAAGLAACAMGGIEEWLPGPRNPSGRVGHVHSVSTEPLFRRRGYSRACMRAILDWFEESGVTNVTLNASAQGQPLYASLGFVRSDDPAMWLYLPEVSRAR
ncbi:MAG TPA: GNAT family N-acetyltransferase [Pseudonocardiaceae bacterium]|jgi:GNAT superfamily N-acetyltransferase|nr:GNAT family N-acetyltransferase [Pseudonocardiaceae bacterium]